MAELTLGRFSFINVMPIYYALEHGIVPHPFSLVEGIPSALNDKMKNGELIISSCSCMEYARRFENYFLVPDLCIASEGPVMSVLLLSRKPLEALEGEEILITGQSHTSVALTKLLFQEYLKVNVSYKTDDLDKVLTMSQKPVAMLTIGDQALRLRKHPSYPYVTDLAIAWKEWTGLPFVFALWVINKEKAKSPLFKKNCLERLRESRAYGLSHLQECINAVQGKTPLQEEELRFYYTHALKYTISENELKGLTLFYKKLVNNGLLEREPTLNFYPTL